MRLIFFAFIKQVNTSSELKAEPFIRKIPILKLFSKGFNEVVVVGILSKRQVMLTISERRTLQ